MNARPEGCARSAFALRIHSATLHVMDYLWTPWRYAYVSGGEKTDGCIFCKAAASNDDEKMRIVYRGRQCFVILNTYPYTPGHAMIVPYAHLDELRKLPLDAAAAHGNRAPRTVPSGRH